MSPPLKPWEEAVHHLLVLIRGHGFGHILVNFVNKLGTMLNHLIHSHFLQEVTIGVAVFAVVKVYAAIGVCSAIIIPGKRHTATLAELG